MLFKDIDDRDVLDDVGVGGDISSGDESGSGLNSFCSFSFKNRGATSYFLPGTCSGGTRGLDCWTVGGGYLRKNNK